MNGKNIDSNLNTLQTLYITKDYIESNHFKEKICCNCYKEREKEKFSSLKVNFSETNLRTDFYHYSLAFIHDQFFSKFKNLAFGIDCNRIVFVCFLKFISICLLLFALPISASSDYILHEKFSKFTKPSLSVDLLINKTNCRKSCSLSFSPGSEKYFCNHHFCCATIYNHCLKSAAIDNRKDVSTNNNDLAVAAKSVISRNKAFKVENHCLKLCNLYQLKYQLFCDHIPLISLFQINTTSDFQALTNCEEKLTEIFKNDMDALEIYTSFQNIITHYVSSQNYSNKGNQDLCLVSFHF